MGRKVLKIKFQENGYIMPFSDSHIGNLNHNKLMYKYFLGWLYENKKYFVYTGGDMIECASKNSVGLEEQIMDVDDQIEQVIKDLYPIAEEGRLIGMIRGNHENRARKFAGVDVTKHMARELNTKYLGIAFNMDIKAGKKTYTVYATHGNSRATTKPGKLNACYKLKDIYDVDLYCMSHLHELDASKLTIYRHYRGKVLPFIKHFLLTGHYLGYLDSYGEEKCYAPPGAIGSAKIKFHSEFNRISIKI